MKKILLTLTLCLFTNASYADVIETRETLSENLNTAVRDLKESLSKTQKKLSGTRRTTAETKEVAKELFERSREEEQNPTVLTHGRKEVVDCDQATEVLVWKDNTWQCGSALVVKDCVPAADEYVYEDENGNKVCSKTEKGKNLEYFWKFRGHSSKCVNVNEGRLKLYDCYYKNKQGTDVQVEDAKCSSKSKPNASKALCTANWSVGGWGGCSKSCGGGVQYRSVTCPGGYTCPAAKPGTSQRCNTHQCTTYWRTGAWGSCSVSCGGGRKYRSVWCPSGYRCTGSKPSTVTSCNNNSCGGGNTCIGSGGNCGGGSSNSGGGGGGR